jgi:hypothetical protein
MNASRTCGSRRTLEALLMRLGDAGVLCRRLWISRAELDGYLSGARAIPLCVSLHALDLIMDDAGRPSAGLA